MSDLGPNQLFVSKTQNYKSNSSLFSLKKNLVTDKAVTPWRGNDFTLKGSPWKKHCCIWQRRHQREITTSYSWIQLMCRRQLCWSRNSNSSNQHDFKTMHRTQGSIRLPLDDILSIFNDVRWPQKTGESYLVHRKILTSGTQRKHPNKQAANSVNRKIHRGKHLAQVRDAFRDKGHTPAHAVLFPIDKDSLLLDILCVYVYVYVCESVSLSLCRLVCLTTSIAGIINYTLEFAPF